MDWNNDGKIDVVTTDLHGPVRLYVNETPIDNHWVRLRLVGTRGPRIPLGAVVRIQPVEQSSGTAESDSTAAGKPEPPGTTWLRQMVGGGSYMSSHQPEIHVGVGSAERVGVEVRWPCGAVSTYELDVDRQHTLVEPTSRRCQR